MTDMVGTNLRPSVRVCLGGDVNDIVVHPVDEAVMIPNDAHMIDANGILEHDPVPASGNAKH